MTKTSDKVAGKTKQLIAEVTGDGKLAEEGKKQARKPDKEPAKPGTWTSSPDRKGTWRNTIKA